MANHVDLVEIDKLAKESQSRIVSLSKEATQAPIGSLNSQEIAFNTFEFYKHIYGNKGGARMLANLDTVKKSSKYDKAINTIAVNYRSIKMEKLSAHLQKLLTLGQMAGDPVLPALLAKIENIQSLEKQNKIKCNPQLEELRQNIKKMVNDYRYSYVVHQTVITRDLLFSIILLPIGLFLIPKDIVKSIALMLKSSEIKKKQNELQQGINKENADKIAKIEKLTKEVFHEYKEFVERLGLDDNSEALESLSQFNDFLSNSQTAAYQYIKSEFNHKIMGIKTALAFKLKKGTVTLRGAGIGEDEISNHDVNRRGYDAYKLLFMIQIAMLGKDSKIIDYAKKKYTTLEPLIKKLTEKGYLPLANIPN